MATLLSGSTGALVAGSILYGTYYPAIALMLAQMAPHVFAFWATLIILIFSGTLHGALSLKHGPLPALTPVQHKALAGCGLAAAAYDIALLTALSVAPKFHVLALSALWPFVFVVFSGFVFRLTPRTPRLTDFVWMTLAFTGLVLVLGQNHDAQTGSHWEGWALGLSLAVLTAAFNVLLLVFDRGIDPTHERGISWRQSLRILLYVNAWVVPPIFFYSLTQTPTFDWPLPSDWPGLLYVGLAVLSMGQILWAVGLSRSKSSDVAVLSYLSPVLAFGLLALFDDHPIGLTAVCGVAMVLIANWYLQRDEWR